MSSGKTTNSQQASICKPEVTTYLSVNNDVNKDPAAADDTQKTVDDTPPFDNQYLMKVLGEVLAEGLSIVVQTRPADPIEYLAQLLHKHAQNVASQKLVGTYTGNLYVKCTCQSIVAKL